MFRNLPLVLIEHSKDALPTHKWGWAGSIPLALCDKREALRADNLAGRSFKGEDGKWYAWSPRSYANKEAALADAKASGVKLDPNAGTNNA